MQARQSSGEGAPAAQPSPAGQSPTPSCPAPYKQLRYDEDWGALLDPVLRAERLDRIKYIPLREKEGWYLSIGGEVRERFGRFGNPSWGEDPEDDNGFILQRYMLHADLHLGARVRVFGQVKSGLERGRKGGPEPADEDRLDLHQAFVDFKFAPVRAACSPCASGGRR